MTITQGHKAFGLKKDTQYINFMQLLDIYGVFYTQGKSVNSKIVQTNNPLVKQIVSKENAQKIKKTLPAFFEVMRDEKFTFTYRDSNITASIYMQELKMESKNYLEAFFIVDADDNYEYDESEVKVSDKFWFGITQRTLNSPANIYHEYIFYSKADKNKKIAKVTNILNRYQVTNRQESEAIVKGIYTDDNGNYFIDRLTSAGTELATCNACQKYNVETFQITEDGVFSVNLRAYDIETYMPFQTQAKDIK